MSTNYIPAATQKLLDQNHPEGTRHAAAVQMATPLLGNGHSPAETFALIMPSLGGGFPEKELWDIIGHAVANNPGPSGHGGPEHRSFARPAARPPAPPVQPKRSPQQHCDWWMSGATKDAESFSETSKVPLPEDPNDALYLFFQTLYGEDDHINIVTLFTEEGGKTRPSGSGKTMARLDWQSYLGRKGIPMTEAGAWVRMNPVKGTGSGAGGAITDADVTKHRFLLVESDSLPIGTQLALYSRLRLPIAAVISSGGKSAHAWVRLDCPDEASYAATAKRILAALEPFGIDQPNKNPSRLSRLPGAVRQLGAVGDGKQSLLFLAPRPDKFSDVDLQCFEESLLLPALEEFPCRKHEIEAVARYEDLMENRGRLGVLTGINNFDSVTGGLKPGQLTIIAAETGGGKSSFALNIINTSLKQNLAVALFTLEMDKDEIWDLLVAMNATVNRNAFNTGRFTPEDITAITQAHKRMRDYLLFMTDHAVQTAKTIRQEVLRLKAERALRLVVVDYAQLVSPENPKEMREQQVAMISRSLRMLAKEAKVPILVLSQLNEDGKVRESRALAHDAHNVVILEGTCTVMNVTKGRTIPRRKYELTFDPLYAQVSGKIGT